MPRLPGGLPAASTTTDAFRFVENGEAAALASALTALAAACMAFVNRGDLRGGGLANASADAATSNLDTPSGAEGEHVSRSDVVPLAFSTGTAGAAGDAAVSAAPWTRIGCGEARFAGDCDTAVNLGRGATAAVDTDTEGKAGDSEVSLSLIAPASVSSVVWTGAAETWAANGDAVRSPWVLADAFLAAATNV